MVDFKNVVKKWDFQKTVTKIKDTKNFEIQKAGRFAARFFQGATALIMYYFLAAQQPAFTAANKLQTLAVISPVVSGGLIAMYVFPWFSHSWTSRRILAIETFLDLFMALAMFSVFFVDLTLIGGQCDQNVLGCGTFTWLLTWLFFHAASWFAGLVFDGTAWHRGLSTSQEIDGDILLDIRRTTRSHR